MSAVAAHHGLLADLIAFWSAWWWAILLFGGSVLEWIAETCGIGLAALQRASKRRHKRQLQVKRLELAIAEAKSRPPLIMPPTTLAKQPGPCVHRNVVQVRSRSDELVGWLCRACDEQLPANWATAEEDL